MDNVNVPVCFEELGHTVGTLLQKNGTLSCMYGIVLSQGSAYKIRT